MAIETIISIIVGILLAVSGFLLSRTLIKIDRNSDDLYTRMKIKSNWLDFQWIDKTQTKLTTLRYEDMDWLFVFNHYDIHLSGLCYYKNKICWFQVEEWDADEVFYYIYALPFKDKLILLWHSFLFNWCIGTHWSYRKGHRGQRLVAE